VPLGIFTSYCIVADGRSPTRHFNVIVSPLRGEARIYLVWAIAVLAIASFVDQLLRIDEIPLALILFGADRAELMTARDVEYKGRDGITIYIWNFNRMVFVPMLVVSTFVKLYAERSFAWFIVFVTVLLLAVANNGLSGANAPVSLLFVVMFIAYY